MKDRLVRRIVFESPPVVILFSFANRDVHGDDGDDDSLDDEVVRRTPPPPEMKTDELMAE